jgi:hypothetical protein
MKFINIILIFKILFGIFSGADGEDFIDAPMGSQYFEGSGMVSGADAEILKALTTGNSTDIATLTQGQALQVQSLEGTMALLTFQEKAFKLIKDIGVSNATSTLEEYTVQDGYGAGGGEFLGELDIPDEDDADLLRNYAKIKFTRALWRVSDVQGLVKTISSAEIIQKQAAMMRILRATEKALFNGDSSIVPSSIDGIASSIKNNTTPDHIIDLRGASFSEVIFRNAAELVSQNYGQITKLYLSNAGASSLSNILGKVSQETLFMNVPGSTAQNLALGNIVKTIVTPFGNFGWENDIFINPESETVPMIRNPSDKKSFIEGATSSKSPATPSLSIAIDAPTVSGSLWSTASGEFAPAGVTYKYRVAALNSYGKSAACAEVTSGTILAAGSITLTITSGGGTYAPTGYIIYREVKSGPSAGKITLMKKVAAGTGATTVVVDKNEDLSGTSVAYAVDNTSVGEMRTMALKRLGPTHSVDYSKIGPFKWGAINSYLAPIFYAPLRMVMFKNVGVASAYKSPVIEL